LNSNNVDWFGNKAGEFGVVPVPTLSDVQRVEAENSYQAIQRAMRPPEFVEFAGMITALSFHLGMQTKDPAAIKSMMGDYFDDFGHYPAFLIKDACKRYRNDKDTVFMPKSGQFKALMDREYFKLKSLRDRLEILLGVYKKPEDNGLVNLTSFLKRV